LSPGSTRAPTSVTSANSDEPVFPLTPVPRDRAEMSIVQNYQLMQACAEKLTALKKYMEDPECNPQEVETLHKEFRSLETQLHQALAGAGTVPVERPPDESSLTEMLDPFIPRCGGTICSIGSIPHAYGMACVGPCRFHRKGKCFDGVLCRFCHFPDEHPGAVKKAAKKAKKTRKAPCVDPGASPLDHFGAVDSLEAFARWRRGGAPEFRPAQVPLERWGAPPEIPSF
jgi:hypothetical protein